MRFCCAIPAAPQRLNAVLAARPSLRLGRAADGCCTDHVSILKFIEANWRLSPLTNRSRDNFPNPHASRNNPYVPLNSPAIGDLMDLFNFSRN